MSYQADVQEYNKMDKSGEDSLQSEAMRKMFVGGLNRDTNEDTLESYFCQFGEVEDKVIITDPTTKASRGFGFVTFKNSDSIQDAFKSRPHKLDGKEVEIKRAMPREFNTPASHAKTTRLFVGGFKGFDLEPQELREYLEARHPPDFGRIDNIDFLKDKDSGTNKGFGFIDCSDHDFSDRLAISESSFTLKGRTMSIKKAEPKDGGAGGGSGGRGGRGGGMGQRGGRGGRGGRGAGRGAGASSRGGYNNNYNQQGGGYNQNGYNSSGGSYNQGGYNQSYGGGYGSNQSSGGYNNNQSGGYGNQSGGGYGSQSGAGYTGYNMQQQAGYGGYNANQYSNQGGYDNYNYGSYNQQSGGGAQRGRGGGQRGGTAGAQRYNPY